MRKITDPEIVGPSRTAHESSAPYLVANFDIEEYIKTMQGKLNTVTKLDGVLEKLEGILTDPAILTKFEPSALISLYKAITTRSNMEANLVSRFVDDSTKNTLLKKRMLLEQKKIDRENNAYQSSAGVSDLAKSIKNIFINRDRAEGRGEAIVDDIGFDKIVKDAPEVIDDEEQQDVVE